MPLILFGSDFWSGLVSWMKQSLLDFNTVSEIDFDLIKITDDVNEVVSIMTSHREWKKEQIVLSKEK